MLQMHAMTKMADLTKFRQTGGYHGFKNFGEFLVKFATAKSAGWF